MPTFSILIPAFKVKFLREAIASCIAQTYADFEVIIVDDCSSENLKDVVAAFQDFRIHYYRNDRNIGAINVVDNWNKCLSLSSGEYVICMGDDDKLLPNCLSLYADLQKRYPHVDVYHTWTQIIDENSEIVALQEPRPEWESALSALYFRWDCRWKQFIGDFCFRAKALKEAGGFYKLPLAWGSDDLSVFRAAMKGGIANAQQFGFQYRVNRYTITNSGNQKMKAEAHLLEKQWFQNVLQTCPLVCKTDILFKQILMFQLDDHYRGKIASMLEEDLTNSVRNLKYWLDNKNKYSFTASYIWKMFIHVVRKTKRISL